MTIFTFYRHIQLYRFVNVNRTYFFSLASSKCKHNMHIWIKSFMYALCTRNMERNNGKKWVHIIESMRQNNEKKKNSQQRDIKSITLVLKWVNKRLWGNEWGERVNVRAYMRSIFEGMCHMSMSHNGWMAWRKSLFARKCERVSDWLIEALINTKKSQLWTRTFFMRFIVSNMRILCEVSKMSPCEFEHVSLNFTLKLITKQP